jgi:hypothetical protein
LSAGVLVFSTLLSRPLRTSWAIVGNLCSLPTCCRLFLLLVQLHGVGRLFRFPGTMMVATFWSGGAPSRRLGEKRDREW